MTICLTVKKANKRGAKKLCVSSGLYGHKEALALEAQMLINYLVDEIVMYDDKIEIFFHKPTRNSPDESRGCFVYKGRKENFDIEIWIV